jgi:hypothetical protein
MTLGERSVSMINKSQIDDDDDKDKDKEEEEEESEAPVDVEAAAAAAISPLILVFSLIMFVLRSSRNLPDREANMNLCDLISRVSSSSLLVVIAEFKS